MLSSCHGCSDRLTCWTFAFNLVANANLCVCMISVYLTNVRATGIKIEMKPCFTQCVGAMLACPKSSNDSFVDRAIHENRLPI